MSATEHGFDAYLPLPRAERRGTALCMSGGGYRAALFHLGALRRLNELGVLAQVDTFTCVSGGSIITAVLAAHVKEHGGWPKPGREWEEAIAEPLRRFTQTDIRTRSVISAYHPKNWFDQNAGVDELARRYAAGPAPGLFADLPQHPRFVFCATDVLFRTQWVFDSGRRVAGEDKAGFGPPGEWTLAEAAAASSCVPGAFRPMRVRRGVDELEGGSYRGRDRAELVERMDLTDGGIYDNLGLEPVWHDHAVVLVSDGAPSFKPDPNVGRLWRALRHAATLLEQATDVRKRWLISNFIAGHLEGAYWSMSSLPESYEHDPRAYEPELRAYPRELIEDAISQVRIDLDRFSEGEIAVLENHGYLMAEIANRRHTKHLAAASAPAPALPHPDWMSEERARKALASSHRTRFFRRPRPFEQSW
jgi:NTE family protein